jgi:hypothetical protein
VAGPFSIVLYFKKGPDTFSVPGLPLAGPFESLASGLQACHLGLELGDDFLQFGQASIAFLATRARHVSHKANVEERGPRSCASFPKNRKFWQGWTPVPFPHKPSLGAK